jgi:hypothetical protein
MIPFGVAALTWYFYKLVIAMLAGLWHMSDDLFPLTHLRSE